MKRLPIALFALAVCLIAASALGDTKVIQQEAGQPLYEAVSTVSFHIRKTPEDNSRRIKEIGSHKTLLVYEFGDQWCKVQYDNALGYCKSEWLYRYRSLQPEKTFIPEYPVQEGFAQVISPFQISVLGYEGNDLLPGSLISIHQWNNALCAPYKKANGYKVAPNISDDGQGYGGGICQLTTTIYNAALSLPLQIEEWNIQRDSGVPYIPKGFDAAVGSYSDFIFKNTLPYDIRLAAMPQNGALTVLIYRN